MRRAAFFVSITTLVVALLIVPIVAAQSTGGYDLSWSTIASGGSTSSNGGYSLSGTIGQADAGVLSGGSYTLQGGFWNGLSEPHRVYLPLVLR